MNKNFIVDLPPIEINTKASVITDALGVDSELVKQVSQKIFKKSTTEDCISDNTFLVGMDNYIKGGISFDELKILIFFAFKFFLDAVQGNPKLLEFFIEETKELGNG